MNALIQTFKSDNARFQVERGNGVMVQAGEMTDLHVGRGLYHELFRDHEWLCISKVTAREDGQVDIEYLELKSSQNKSTEGNSTIEVTEQRVIRHTLTCERGDDVLISADPVPRPQGRRIKFVTTRTRTEEPLED